MRASYNWLKEYCDFDLPAHELADRLSHAGLNVDTYEPCGRDYAMEVEITANRPDCLCHMGLAREIAALVGSSARQPEVHVEEDASEKIDDVISVRVDAPDLCPHYSARVVKDVKIAPSPDWLQQRLTACGIRPVNNIVDVTNFVMFECGQPLHAFDLARIGGGKIIVRAAVQGETITTIDGTGLELCGEECVIADESRPVALAGVMGGIESEIGDTTTDVLLEAARFDPRNNRRTSRRHNLPSDSSYRYERGIDPEITDWASRRACQLMVEIAGGQLLTGVASARADETRTPEVTLRLSRLALVLGIEVSRDIVLKAFRGLGLDVLKEESDAVTVRVPSWRPDLLREIDLIEEVARIHGYDKINETTDMPVREVMPSTAQLAERRTRRLLSGLGFYEIMTYSLVPSGDELQTCQPWHDGPAMAVRNPVSSEHDRLRLTCMVNALHAKGFNQAHGTPRVDLFELGRIYIPQGKATQPDEKLCLTVLTDRDEGLRVLKGVLDALVDEMAADVAVTETPGGAGPFGPGEAVELRIGDDFLGVTGVVDAQVADDLDLRNAPAVMEIDYELLARHCRLDRPYRAVPTFPGTGRDIAIVVDDGVLWADVERVVRAAAPETLEAVEFMDVYRGEHIPAGRKSVAFSLTFRRQDRTITAPEAEEGREAILTALRSELGAELR